MRYSENSNSQADNRMVILGAAVWTCLQKGKKFQVCHCLNVSCTIVYSLDRYVPLTMQSINLILPNVCVIDIILFSNCVLNIMFLNISILIDVALIHLDVYLLGIPLKEYITICPFCL